MNEWKLRDALADKLDPRVILYKPRHLAGEGLSINGKRPARRHGRGPRAGEHRASHRFKLVLEQPRGAVGLCGLERVGADELGEKVGVVRRGLVDRALLVERHVHAAPRELKRALAPREATANDNYALTHVSPFADDSRTHPRNVHCAPRGTLSWASIFHRADAPQRAGTQTR